MKPSQPEAALEALLFAAGEAVSFNRLMSALELERGELKEVLRTLALRYEESGRGIQLIEFEDNYKLGTKAEYSDYITALTNSRQKKQLTPSLVETLAIIAYKQPVTKNEIEQIRGVGAEHAVSKLIEYGLVCENGRLDAPGRPLLFSTTEDFLIFYGLKSLKELPELPKEHTDEFIQLAFEDAADTKNVTNSESQ